VITNRFRRHRFTVLFAVVAACIISAEYTARQIIGRVQQRTYRQWKANERRYRVASLDYDHGLRPNVSLDVSWGAQHYPMRTNSLGLRDREVREVPLASTHRRIVIIGDSFTEGLGVAYEATFVGRFEEALKMSDPTVTVLNAAVVSYYPALYLAKIRWLLARGLQFSDVIVCIDLSDAEDEFTSTGRSRAPVDPVAPDEVVAGQAPATATRDNILTAYVRYHTVVTIRLMTWLHGKIDPPIPPEVAPSRGRWTIDDAEFSKIAVTGNARAVAHMTDLAAMLAARGITLTVVVYPWPAQIYYRDRDSKQVRLWRDWSRTAGARFIDIFPTFMFGPSPLDTIHQYFISGDVHWNEAGHSVVARALTDQWRALNSPASENVSHTTRSTDRSDPQRALIRGRRGLRAGSEP
jgi:lysophospholipase L1-like esterase